MGVGRLCSSVLLGDAGFGDRGVEVRVWWKSDRDTQDRVCR